MRHQSPIRVTRSWIPNSVTAFSVFLGYLSIVYTFEGQFIPAAWLIVLAGVLDLMDGRLARAVGGTSKFGSYFDSLADAINYGVAPSLLFYRIYFIDWALVGSAFSFLPTVCGAIRLARFNVLTEEEGRSEYFLGLPTTVAAGFLASFVIFSHDLSSGLNTPALAAILLAGASLLMVGMTPFDHNTAITERGPRKNWKALLLLIALLTVLIFPSRALFFWLALYISFGVLRSLLNPLAGKFHQRNSS